MKRLFLLDVNVNIRVFERSYKEGEVEEVDQPLRQTTKFIRGREERLRRDEAGDQIFCFWPQFLLRSVSR